MIHNRMHYIEATSKHFERLKTQYNNLGLTVIRPAKPRVSRAGVPYERKRLPPIIL